MSERPSRPTPLGHWRVRTELGLFAFAPVLALLGVRARNEDWAWVVFAIPAAAGVLFAAGAWLVVRRSQPETFELHTIDDAGDEVIGHVSSYLLPVLVDVTKSMEQVVFAGIAISVIVLLHVTTGRVQVNPLLHLFGYRTYRATAGPNHRPYYLLARTDPAAWPATRDCRQIGASILIEAPNITRTGAAR